MAYAPLVAEGFLAGVHYEGPYLSAGPLRRAEPGPPARPRPRRARACIDLGAARSRMVTARPRAARRARRHRVARRPRRRRRHRPHRRDLRADPGRRRRRRRRRHPRLQRDAPDPPPRARPDRRPARRRRPWSASRSPTACTCTTACSRFASSVAGAGRVALVTDAMAAAGMPDGDTNSAASRSTVADGVARLTARTASIAGSTLTMDAAFRRAAARRPCPSSTPPGWPPPPPRRRSASPTSSARSPGPPRRPRPARRVPARHPSHARRHLALATTEIDLEDLGRPDRTPSPSSIRDRARPAARWRTRRARDGVPGDALQDAVQDDAEADGGEAVGDPVEAQVRRGEEHHGRGAERITRSRPGGSRPPRRIARTPYQTIALTTWPDGYDIPVGTWEQVLGMGDLVPSLAAVRSVQIFSGPIVR